MPECFIICPVCGCRGKAGNLFIQNHSGESCFKHLGHDPFRGNMHYCCPSCGRFLFVDPMEMLSGQCVAGIPDLRESVFFQS